VDALKQNVAGQRGMKRVIKSSLAVLGYQIQGIRYCPRQLLEATLLRRLEFDDVVCRRMFETSPSLTFVQVGAFDGVTGDPLRKYIDRCGWSGIVVEPQSTAVNQLRKLYEGNRRIVILQGAIDGKCGRKILYTVHAEGVPSWAGGLASFHRENIVKHSSLIPGVEEMIREESVECITFDTVLESLRDQRVDLLQIDTEGADGYVLSLFPFDRVRPSIVHWEIKHLGRQEQERCLGQLASLGYRFATSGGEDMLAVLDTSSGHRMGAG